MSIPSRETSGLEVHVDKKGRLRLTHLGVRIPLSSISVDGGGFGDRGAITLSILTQFVTFVHDEDT